MTTVRELIEKLQALPPYALDHPVLLSIDERRSGSIYVADTSDGVILHQSQLDCAGFPEAAK